LSTKYMSAKNTDMTNSAKKKSERYFLEVFKKLLPDFPEGEIVGNEGPDFQVHSWNGSIGIEIARLYQRSPKNTPSLQAIEAEGEIIVQLAHKFYNEMNLTPVNVNVTFQSKAALMKKNRLSIASELARIVAKAERLARPMIIIDYESNTEGIFFKEIDSIRIAKVNDDFWGTSGSGMVQSDFVDELQERINEKNMKREKYRSKCDKCWLLIVADGFGASSAFFPSEDTISNQYHSLFDRTFFLEGISQKFFELRTEKY
jgi:hypothetical protein